MKNTIYAIATCICLGLSTLAHADDASHRAATEELLKTMEVPSMLGKMRPIMEQALNQSYSAMSPKPETQAVFEKFSTRLADIMAEEMSWEKIKDVYIDIYTESFTEAEIMELNQMFSTPIGKKFASSSADLMQTAALRMQPVMMDMQQKVAALIEEMAKEVQAAEGQ